MAEEEYYQLDQAAIDKEAMYDGFYAVNDRYREMYLRSSLSMRGRWQIEECFQNNEDGL